MRFRALDDAGITVRVIAGNAVVAEHVRSWERRQVIELPAHRAALVAERRVVRDLKGRDRLRAVVPTFDHIVARWAVSRVAEQYGGAKRLAGQRRSNVAHVGQRS